MLLAIRPSVAPVGGFAANRQNTRSKSPIQDCEDKYSRQQPKPLISLLIPFRHDTAKFSGSVNLTRELVEGAVGNQRALLALAKEAAKDEDSKDEMIGYLIELQESSWTHKNKRSIYEASKQHLHSEEIEKNYRNSLSGFFSTSGEDVRWGIAPC